MDSKALFEAGKLAEAIDAQIAAVKAAPEDKNKRLFLFELAAFSGDLDRARRQIDAIQYDEPELQVAIVGYKALLEAEGKRRRLFSESLEPKFLSEPPRHVRLRLEAILRLRENRPAAAQELLDEAQAEAPTLTGTFNGQPFVELTDADELFGTVLEVFSRGDYYWLPLEQVESIAINPPKFPRDLLWIPARLETAEAGGEIYLPSLYPNSHEHPDSQVRLGRMTDWIGEEEGPQMGRGLRMHVVGDLTPTILEWRELVINPQPDAAA